MQLIRLRLPACLAQLEKKSLTNCRSESRHLPLAASAPLPLAASAPLAAAVAAQNRTIGQVNGIASELREMCDLKDTGVLQYMDHKVLSSTAQSWAAMNALC